MSTSRYLIDIFIRHQVYLEGLKAEIAGTFDPLVEDVERSIITAISSAGVQRLNELSPAQLDDLIEQIRISESSLFGGFASDLSHQLEGVAEYESDFAARALEQALLEETINPVNPGAAWLYAQSHPVQATGELLGTFVENWTAREMAAVEAILRNAHAQGWTIQETVTAIRGTARRNYADGVMARLRRDVETIVRTSIQHVSNSARIAALSANVDIILGYRWVSTLDSRTTPVCRSLDGRVFEIGAGPIPPIHLNCRSTIVPEMEETVKMLGGILRAGQGGAVPANMTYYEWLKDQPASFQDSVLGPTRGKLFRNGGLTADEFARLNLGRTFRSRTLDEMRSLRPEVFNRAGL